jgi:hypothetical protein
LFEVLKVKMLQIIEWFSPKQNEQNDLLLQLSPSANESGCWLSEIGSFIVQSELYTRCHQLYKFFIIFDENISSEKD